MIKRVKQRVPNTGACEKNTPQEKKTVGNMSFQNTKSGGGEQFVSPDYRVKARVRGAFLHRRRWGVPENSYLGVQGCGVSGCGVQNYV